MYNLGKQHVELRQSYLEGLAEAIVTKRLERGNHSKSKILEFTEKQVKALQERESTRRTFAKLRYFL
jgi:hypothetical protein